MNEETNCSKEDHLPFKLPFIAKQPHCSKREDSTKALYEYYIRQSCKGQNRVVLQPMADTMSH